MTGTIVYYAVGPVHLQNLQLIAQEMPNWSFCLAYRPKSVWWLTPQHLDSLSFERIALTNDQVPEALWLSDVRAVIFSTVQPKQAVINLLYGALVRNVPTIAVEESLQIAFNGGRINNYVLPVDCLLVGSDHERRGMIAAGISEQRVEVTGWPFYAGRMGKATPGERTEMKQRLGLDPDKPVAALTLTALHDAGESPAVRCRQLALASRGVPSGFQLVIKPHPIEPIERLMPFVEAHAPQAAVVDGSVPIHELLGATDVLLNRGVSQVCVEALLQCIPVVVLDTGITTPFHGPARSVVVTSPSELTQTLLHLTQGEDPMRAYNVFMETHMPYSPLEARRRVCHHLVTIASQLHSGQNRAEQQFDLGLYQAWRFDHSLAVEMLSQDNLKGADQPVNALRRLVQFQATREDLRTLLSYSEDDFRGQVLRCLWIDQLVHRRERPTKEDLEWMRGFPPHLNTSWFAQHLERWASLLLTSGYKPAARAWAERLEREFLHVRAVPELIRRIELGQKPWGRAVYRFGKAMERSQVFVRRLGGTLARIGRGCGSGTADEGN